MMCLRGPLPPAPDAAATGTVEPLLLQPGTHDNSDVRGDGLNKVPCTFIREGSPNV